MTRFWIRVNARLADDAEVRAFAFVLFQKAPAWLAVRTTCGLLVSLWGRVIDEQEDGDVSGRDDHALEEWAGWGGKRGLFAKEFRARFTTDGMISQWDDYQGTLISRRERDRNRKRGGKPTEGAPNSSGIPAEVRTHSSGNGNGNENNTAHSVDEARLLDALADDTTRTAWAAEIDAHRQGMHGQPMTEEQIAKACRQYVGNGHASNPNKPPTLRHFSGFLESARRPPVMRTFTPTPTPSKQEATRNELAAWAGDDNGQ